MKENVKLPALIAVVVVALVVLGFVIKSMSGIGNLDNGQVKYTPGVPPWAENDAAKKGPGGSPAGGPPPSGPPAGAAPAIGQDGKSVSPPGMSAPARG